MSYSQFQEQYAKDAEAEYNRYVGLSAEALLAEAQAGRYGGHYQLWRAIAERVRLREAAPILVAILRGNAEYLVRYHAAAAVLGLAQLKEPTPAQLAIAGRAARIDALEAQIAAQLG